MLLAYLSEHNDALALPSAGHGLHKIVKYELGLLRDSLPLSAGLQVSCLPCIESLLIACSHHPGTPMSMQRAHLHGPSLTFPCLP